MIFYFHRALQPYEDMDYQELAVDLAESISCDADEEVKTFFDNLPGFPHEHYEVMKKFGRYPSRNDALVGHFFSSGTISEYKLCVKLYRGEKVQLKSWPGSNRRTVPLGHDLSEREVVNRCSFDIKTDVPVLIFTP